MQGGLTTEIWYGLKLLTYANYYTACPAEHDHVISSVNPVVLLITEVHPEGRLQPITVEAEVLITILIRFYFKINYLIYAQWGCTITRVECSLRTQWMNEWALVLGNLHILLISVFLQPDDRSKSEERKPMPSIDDHLYWLTKYKIVNYRLLLRILMQFWVFTHIMFLYTTCT